VVVENLLSKCYQRDTVVVDLFPAFSVEAKDTTACVLNDLELEVKTIPSGNYVYQWTKGNLLSDSTIANPVTNLSANTTFVVTVEQDGSGCQLEDTLTVIVYPDFDLEVSPDQVICPYETDAQIVAEASPGSGFEYYWSPGAALADSTLSSQNVNPPVTTTYYVLAHKSGGCYKLDSVEVDIYDDILDLTASGDTSIFKGDSITLQANGASLYLWKPAKLLTDPTHSFIHVGPSATTVYSVIGYDACYSDTLSINVEVIPITFFIPNLITPNGDSNNDNFEISNYGHWFDVVIYNRWGDLVYQKNSYRNEWGEVGVKDGVYYYDITDTRDGKTYKGWVEVRSREK
jgi:gliding motility-associated-like protein